MSFALKLAPFLAPLALVAPRAAAQDVPTLVSPYASWSVDAPGVLHRFAPSDTQPLIVTDPVLNFPTIVPQPADAHLAVPPGFQVQSLTAGLVGPRIMRFAPNKDIFVSEGKAGRVTILHMSKAGDRVVSTSTFASGLDWPFGIAFWPPGPNPHFVYVGSWDKIVRYPYRTGDATARGPAEIVLGNLPTMGHWTRDLAFTADGRRLFVSLGSLSNDAETMPKMSLAQVHAFEAVHGRGAAWGDETGRANVLETTPSGHPVTLYASGMRNCVGMAIGRDGNTPWCVVNERDQRGDTSPGDYVTSVTKGGFYGWPWFYNGNHEDPIHKGERPDLMGHVTSPDMLFPAHSAPLDLAFYNASQFPATYSGSIFVTMHGSCCRASDIIGYKVVRLLMKNGRPTGTYEDFLTGFIIDGHHVWGRPVGVTVAPDGGLLVSDDGSGTIWRITHSNTELSQSPGPGASAPALDPSLRAKRRDRTTRAPQSTSSARTTNPS